MKKRLFVACLLAIALFGFVSHSFAEENVQLSFFIGEFELNKVNWNDTMEAQLLEGLSGTPEDVFVEVVGRTDQSGTDEINIPLSQRRSDFIAEKIKKIKPGAEVESKGVIYSQKDGQNIDYKMVEVKISYQKESLLNPHEGSLTAINSHLSELQKFQREIVERFDKLNNTQSIKALEFSILQFGQSLSDQTRSLNSGLAENKNAVEDVMNEYFETIKKYLLLQGGHFFDKLQEESNASLEESKRINNSMKEMLDSLGKVEQIQISDTELLGKQGSSIYKALMDNNSKTTNLLNEIQTLKNGNDSVRGYILYGFFALGILFVIQIFLLFYRKK